MEFDGFAGEAVEVRVQDAAEDGAPGAGGREDGQATHGRGGLFVAFEEFEQRYDEQHGGRDVQGEDVEVAEDGQDGRAALRAVGGQEEGQGDQEEIGGGDQYGGLAEGQGVQAFLDTVKGRHGAERGLGDMESLRDGVKRKRRAEDLPI